jgi:hypothetical protein
MPYPLVNRMAPLGALAPAFARVHVRGTLNKWHMPAFAEVAELLTSDSLNSSRMPSRHPPTMAGAPSTSTGTWP